MQLLGNFENHEGFDGIMLGHADSLYHLEFTRHRNSSITPTPTAEDLLVFYVPDTNTWKSCIGRLEKLGIKSVAAHNPYWDRKGRTYSDPDGYRIVIQNSSWE
jgi:hypothetical protein